MADVLTPEQRKYNMSMIRSRNTKPEISLRKALWSAGLRYRINYKLPGKPDLVFVGKRVAVFVDGCFWHRCPWHCRVPTTNTEYWKEKLLRNVERDREVNIVLEEAGWEPLRFWEHQVKHELNGCVEIVIKELNKVV